MGCNRVTGSHIKVVERIGVPGLCAQLEKSAGLPGCMYPTNCYPTMHEAAERAAAARLTACVIRPPFEP